MKPKNSFYRDLFTKLQPVIANHFLFYALAYTPTEPPSFPFVVGGWVERSEAELRVVGWCTFMSHNPSPELHLLHACSWIDGLPKHHPEAYLTFWFFGSFYVLPVDLASCIFLAILSSPMVFHKNTPLPFLLPPPTARQACLIPQPSNYQPTSLQVPQINNRLTNTHFAIFPSLDSWFMHSQIHFSPPLNEPPRLSNIPLVTLH